MSTTRAEIEREAGDSPKTTMPEDSITVEQRQAACHHPLTTRPSKKDIGTSITTNS
jgi:hypothetical protein